MGPSQRTGTTSWRWRRRHEHPRPIHASNPQLTSNSFPFGVSHGDGRSGSPRPRSTGSFAPSSTRRRTTGASAETPVVSKVPTKSALGVHPHGCADEHAVGDSSSRCDDAMSTSMGGWSLCTQPDRASWALEEGPPKNNSVRVVAPPRVLIEELGAHLSKVPSSADALIFTGERGATPRRASDGNRTRVSSLGSWRSTIELRSPSR